MREVTPWLHRKLTEQRTHLPAPAPRECVSGAGFYYLGRSYRLKLVEPSPQQPALRLHQSRFELSRDRQGDGRELFIAWYRQHLPPRLESHIARLAPRVGATPAALRVRDLGYRWGSCTPQGTLTFHWRVALLPHQMIEYLVAHELVHLVLPSHGAEFWQGVARLIPDYAERRQWLATEGAGYGL